MDLEKIMSAGGMVDVKHHMDVRKDIIVTAKKIRAELGNKMSILDDFMLALFGALSKLSVLDAVEEGFQDATRELRDLIIGIRKESKEVESHPFYAFMTDAIKKNPCPAEEIYTDYYFARHSLEYAEFALQRYVDNRKAVVSAALQEANIDALEVRLTELVDPDEIYRLTELIITRFLIASPSKIFLQCLTDQCILSDLYHDKNTRYVFQHMIDADIE